ncbi:[protein-PII] uridylyltransferase [Alteromonas sediminis]|uniref:Bifunctional uridylyltransferase/uridylyl-removing enzyme n=1 Tax=Alteromonas sediminis TaxID=2259342 RepID=A0A3N5Y3A4_9ALTE|nr:[protein-PII] uridylyltransferase [Alteromonas sediminis]RPJ68362.1 [protein-PII] uridylyltransferase [Alteromonas sediminis]
MTESHTHTFKKLLSEIQSLDSLTDLKGWRSLVERSYAWLDASFNQSDIHDLVTGRAEFVDALLAHAWDLSKLAEDSQIALCAVGGYGRGHLQPHSDIDLLIVSKKALSEDTKERISTFITFLWDIKLDIGQSVRTIKECVKLAKSDLTITTNLVELRYLAGSGGIFDTLWREVNEKHRWSSKAFFLAKSKEQSERHAKFNGTAYNLEPNIKENPGCLRDIQTIAWVAKQHFREYDGQSLVGHGYMTDAEHSELVECRMHLWRLRFALHLISGRSENRLLFDYQPEVAAKMGYPGEGKAPVEAMMRDFFRVISRISELNSMLLLRFNDDILQTKHEKAVPLNDDFAREKHLIAPRHAHVFPTPESLLDFLAVIADTPEVSGLSTDCIRQLRNARRAFKDQYYCERPACREKFMNLMKNPNFFNYAWDVMHGFKILQGYLPAWDQIVGMMQFDLFHAYTVDEHTHRLVKHVAAYFDPEDKRFPRCSRIAKNLDKPELLYLAAIFHDIAKGRNGDHSVLGEQDVQAFCQSHGLPTADGDMIAWLVRHHLLMSVVAQRRDIYDPDVIHDFASTVKSHLHLNLLYALTLADIRATNDNLWNDWKASLLRELYLMTQKALDNGLQCKITLSERVAEHKQKTLDALREEGLDISEAETLWSRFDDDYFSRFKPNQIAWHTKQILAYEKGPEEELLIKANDNSAKGGTEFLIYGKDRPALFAQIASVLDSKNCSIHDAQIMVTHDDYVFDSLLVLENDGTRLGSQRRIDELEQAILEQMRKPGRSHENTRRMSRRMRQLDVPVKIRFYSRGDDATLVELEALDAPGLLAKIGHAFVDCYMTLKLAKISTIGERAEDVFIISNAMGKSLTPQEQINLKQRLLYKLDQLEDISIE